MPSPHRKLTVRDVERITVCVPFRERIAPWNALLVHQWQVVELIRLTTDDPDIVGWGETLPHYTWSRVPDEAVGRARGALVFDLLGDDTLGPGLQMAAYDAAGKAAGVPVWRLLNMPMVRDWCPIAWWNTKMPPEVLAEEAAEAVERGYTSHKMKGRPWFDVVDQVASISAATPPHYRIEIDWNDMLLNSGAAAPVVAELEGFERVSLFESPLPQRDVEGYRQLRGKARRPIAIHMGLPPFAQAVRAEMCDGFVVSGGVSGVLRDGAACAAFDKPFFLQLVGVGLVTALTAHLGAVLPMARWPAVTCIGNYTEELLEQDLTIRDGAIKVPTGPGLGVAVDEAAVARLKMEPPYRLATPRRILTVNWPGGKQVHYAGMHDDPNDGGPAFSHLRHATGGYTLAHTRCWEDFLAGNHPPYARGARLSYHDDDGSPDWANLYERCLAGPVRGHIGEGRDAAQ